MYLAKTKNLTFI